VEEQKKKMGLALWVMTTLRSRFQADEDTASGPLLNNEWLREQRPDRRRNDRKTEVEKKVVRYRAV